MTSGDPLIGARRLREILTAGDIRPTKTLGQNFVIDPNTIRKVVDAAAVGPDDHVLEIGAGAGSLTLGLAAAAGRVTALEVDASLLPVLEQTLASAPNVELVHADALRYDLGSVGANKLVANLPYNIATQVVLAALEAAPSIEGLTVMTQREVGERLAAGPGSKTYGQTSVMVAYFARARVVAPISRRVFYPEPNVDSVLVQITRNRGVPSVDRAAFFAVVRASFGQRRKTMRNNLSGLAGSAGAAAEALERAGVDPGARAETLSLDHFVRLTGCLEMKLPLPKEGPFL